MGYEMVEIKKEAADYQIMTEFDAVFQALEHWWLPDLLKIKEGDPVYIKEVGNHIEIGKADINFIR